MAGDGKHLAERGRSNVGPFICADVALHLRNCSWQNEADIYITNVLSEKMYFLKAFARRATLRDTG